MKIGQARLCLISTCRDLARISRGRRDRVGRPSAERIPPRSCSPDLSSRPSSFLRRRDALAAAAQSRPHFASGRSPFIFISPSFRSSRLNPSLQLVVHIVRRICLNSSRPQQRPSLFRLFAQLLSRLPLHALTAGRGNSPRKFLPFSLTVQFE